MSPAMPKSDPATVTAFGVLLPDHPDVRRKPMFGNLAAFARDQMFMCVSGSGLALRLSPADRDELLAVPGASTFEPMAGRPMKEYAQIPPDWLQDTQAAAPWVARSLEYALALPPKAKPAKKAKKDAGGRQAAGGH